MPFLAKFLYVKSFIPTLLGLKTYAFSAPAKCPSCHISVRALLDFLPRGHRGPYQKTCVQKTSQKIVCNVRTPLFEGDFFVAPIIIFRYLYNINSKIVCISK